MFHQREVGHAAESQYKDSNGVLLTSDSIRQQPVMSYFCSAQKKASSIPQAGQDAGREQTK
jgi:hypothetical protein